MSDLEPTEVEERRAARERALELLYEAEIKGSSVDDVLAGLPLAPAELAVELVRGVEARQDRIDEILTRRVAPRWSLARLAAVDRAILRLGTYELLDQPDRSQAVVINEAVVLARRFGTDDSPRFVNGVLSAVATDVRGPDAAASDPAPAAGTASDAEPRSSAAAGAADVTTSGAASDAEPRPATTADAAGSSAASDTGRRSPAAAGNAGPGAAGELEDSGRTPARPSDRASVPDAPALVRSAGAPRLAPAGEDGPGRASGHAGDAGERTAGRVPGDAGSAPVAAQPPPLDAAKDSGAGEGTQRRAAGDASSPSDPEPPRLDAAKDGEGTPGRAAGDAGSAPVAGERPPLDAARVGEEDDRRVPAAGAEGQVEALVIDLDGVIRRWDEGSLTEAEDALGLPTGAIGAAAFDPERLEPAMRGDLSFEEWCASLGEAVAAAHGVAADAVAKAFAETRWEVDDEVLAVVDRVRERVPVALLSNASSRLVEDLRRAGLADRFDAIVGSADIGRSKPDAEAFLAAAGRLGVAPERCLMVDDLADNVDGARAAGMQAVRFTGVAALREALAAAGLL